MCHVRHGVLLLWVGLLYDVATINAMMKWKDIENQLSQPACYDATKSRIQIFSVSHFVIAHQVATSSITKMDVFGSGYSC